MGRESIGHSKRVDWNNTTVLYSVVFRFEVLTVPSAKSDAVEHPISAQRFPASAANKMHGLTPVGRR